MARGAIGAMSPWRRRSLTIPPTTTREWLHFAIWEMWMGTLLCLLIGFAVQIITIAPTRIITETNLDACYAVPPIPLPCERIIYRGGVLNMAFTALIGMMLIAAAAWFLWELWNASEPKPITDDFLRLLNDSFGRDWRNPFTWPWSRVFWAYGFTAVGAGLSALLVMAVLTVAAPPPKAPVAKIETSQSFRTSGQ